MTQMITEPAPSVWSYPFYRQEELQRALEEYTALQDVPTRRYGDPDERGGYDPEKMADLEMDLARKRSEVDACMEILELNYPRDWRLLDLYYRMGLSTEFGAWRIAAKRQGIRNMRARCPEGVRCTLRGDGDEPEDNRRDLPSCKAMAELCCRTDKGEFSHQLEVAVGRLYVIHERRRDKVRRGES